MHRSFAPCRSLGGLVTSIGVLAVLMFAAIWSVHDYPRLSVVAASLCILVLLGVGLAYAWQTFRAGHFLIRQPIYLSVYRSEQPWAFWLLYGLQIGCLALISAMGLLVIFHKFAGLIG